MSNYVHHIYSPGLYYSSEPRFYSSIALADRTGFASLYGVSGQDRECIEQAGSTKAFAGCVWSERLWLDVDSYEAADEVESKLKEMGYAYISYDTGGRGAHFGILRNAAPSHLLPIQDKAWATEHFKGKCDTSIYSHLHLFRLPGTIHDSTGKPKTLVSRQGGESLVHGKYEFKRNDVNFSPNVANTSSRSIFDDFNVMATTGPAANGNRHPTLVRLAYALKQANVPVDKAYWWLCEANKMFNEPKGLQELEKITKDVYST